MAWWCMTRGRGWDLEGRPITTTTSTTTSTPTLAADPAVARATVTDNTYVPAIDAATGCESGTSNANSCCRYLTQQRGQHALSRKPLRLGGAGTQQQQPPQQTAGSRRYQNTHKPPC
jgi:hypothetical protein